MREIYDGESIPREYADAIMIELTQKGYLLNEDKVDGRFKLAKPWNETEIHKLMEELWCWPLSIYGNHKRRNITKKTGNGRITPLTANEITGVK